MLMITKINNKKIRTWTEIFFYPFKLQIVLNNVHDKCDKIIINYNEKMEFEIYFLIDEKEKYAFKGSGYLWISTFNADYLGEIEIKITLNGNAEEKKKFKQLLELTMV